MAKATKSKIFMVGVPCVYIPLAVIGSYIATKKNLLTKMKNYYNMTSLCKDAVAESLGFKDSIKISLTWDDDNLHLILELPSETYLKIKEMD